MHEKKDRFLHRVFDHLGSIWGVKLRPNFGQKGGGAVGSNPLFWCASLVFLLFRHLDPEGGGYPIGPPPFWEVFGSMLAPFWLHFCVPGCHLRPILEGFDATFQHVYVNSGGLSSTRRTCETEAFRFRLFPSQVESTAITPPLSSLVLLLRPQYNPRPYEQQMKENIIFSIILFHFYRF